MKCIRLRQLVHSDSDNDCCFMSPKSSADNDNDNDDNYFTF